MLDLKDQGNLFLVSLFAHVVVLSILIVNIEFSSRNFVLENSDQNNVINVTVVNASKIQMNHPALLPPKTQVAPKKIVPPKPIAQPPAKVQPQMKVQPEAHHEKVIAIPDHRKKLFQQQLIEKQLLDDLKQAEVKKKKHKDLEKAFAKEMNDQAAKALEQQLQSEKSELANAADSAKMRGIVDKYKALIIESIAQHWLVPNGVDKTLSTELMIRVAPGGTVISVDLEKSSGDESLDRSARAAVFKASPLPVPTKSDEFEPFREFILKVKPENIVTQDNGLT